MDFDPDSGFAILRRRHNRHADIAAQPAPHGAREGKLNPNVLPLASSKAFVRLQKNRYISSASNEQGNRVITGQERCRRGDQPEPQPSPREPWHNARPSTQQSHDPHKRALWTEEQSCWAKPDSLPSLGIQKRVQARSLPCGFDRSRHRHAFLTKSFRASVSSRHDFACFSGDPLLRARVRPIAALRPPPIQPRLPRESGDLPSRTPAAAACGAPVQGQQASSRPPATRTLVPQAPRVLSTPITTRGLLADRHQPKLLGAASSVEPG